MKKEIIGIIVEYNPFHNGHLYQINKIKELYPDSILIVALNGLYTERGDFSILTKEYKTKVALDNGIDIVLELPVMYGTQSADTFAEVAIRILENFHITKLVFGSECDDLDKLKTLAIKQLDENFDKQIKSYLDAGLNYPTSLAKALNIEYTIYPNDLLGISYIKTIIKNKFNIEPILIKRTNNYHDTKEDSKIISAQNIRNKINNNLNISKYTNIDSKNIITINYEIYYKLLKYKINTSNNLNNYLDVCEGIDYRLIKYINSSNTLDEFIENIKTKRYTYNRINRMLIHILLNIYKSTNNNLTYIKILGFNKKGKKYLNNIKETLVIPDTVDKESLQYKTEIIASIIYDLINNTNTQEFEKSNKPLIISD